MSGFVIDASIACSWLLPDERAIVADRAFERLHLSTALAPVLLWYEVGNVLMMARRRKRIHIEQAREGLQKLRTLPIVACPIASDDTILTLADRHGLTAYDAAYLALAIERQLPLATLDRQLVAAAPLEGVALIG
ncbi:MAG: type II toxin-antitoxin system VapC family toxin [Neorhizobium sp.]|nr:type II toxin-antitoxin system VapC family toxin [Neorhizobium sp.]